MENKLEKNQLKFKGYSRELLDYLFEEQLLKEDLYKLFVNQYRIHSDVDHGWRGEFWGKLVRAACSVYNVNKSPKLYNVLKNTVIDMLSVQDEDGRVSSYPREYDFNDWDLWSRKYVMLGMIYFYEICKNNSLKNKIKKYLKKHANYIIKYIGKGKDKRSIFKTSPVYGQLNSCSILSPMVRLYKITGIEKYLKFAKYIVDSGCCSSFDLIEAGLDKSLMPYQFKEKKAYEMMSCYNGILDYYEVTKDEKLLKAAISFYDKLIETDYTIIGCCGTDTEFLDNSSLRQTQNVEEFSQETCVTVTLMDLSKHLYDLTGNNKYIKIIENSVFNTYFGAINNERQTMKDSWGNVWIGDDCIHDEHGPFPFDSYSPIQNTRRGRQVAGYMKLQDGKSYGCCAAIGSFGFGIYGDTIVNKINNDIVINLFDTIVFKTILNEKKLTIDMNANPFKGNKISIKISSEPQTFNMKIRIPEWMENVKVFIDSKEINFDLINDYLIINKNWTKNTILIKYKCKINLIYINEKVAFKRGPIVLASDVRLNKDNNVEGIRLNSKVAKYKFHNAENKLFKSNIMFEATFNNKKYYFIEYAQAGKNFDNKVSNISVWFDTIK